MTQAPDASVMSYEGPNTEQGSYDVWNTIVTDDAAQVISTSWGMCEPDAETAGVQGAYTALFERASAQGQSIFAATGDSGSEDCFASDDSTTEEVDYPASDPWVTAVGGTSLYSSSDQVAWNWCGSLLCAEENGGEGAGGGGLSRYEPSLSEQPEILDWPTAQPCGTECREVPRYLCECRCGNGSLCQRRLDSPGGTSFAAPFMGGLVADADSGCGRIGVMTPLLYDLYDAGSYGSAFDDITSGNNDLTGSNGGAFPATSGYDAATGIGGPPRPD